MSKTLIAENKVFVGYYDILSHIKNPFKKFFTQILIFPIMPFTFFPIHEIHQLYIDDKTQKISTKIIIV